MWDEAQLYWRRVWMLQTSTLQHVAFASGKGLLFKRHWQGHFLFTFTQTTLEIQLKLMHRHAYILRIWLISYLLKHDCSKVCKVDAHQVQRRSLFHQKPSLTALRDLVRAISSFCCACERLTMPSIRIDSDGSWVGSWDQQTEVYKGYMVRPAKCLCRAFPKHSHNISIEMASSCTEKETGSEISRKSGKEQMKKKCWVEKDSRKGGTRKITDGRHVRKGKGEKSAAKETTD